MPDVYLVHIAGKGVDVHRARCWAICQLMGSFTPFQALLNRRWVRLRAWQAEK
jgi:hypothetical protein